jgi:hypothetical protein
VQIAEQEMKSGGTGAGIENNKTLDASKVALFKRHIFLTFCPLFL